jgi:hypothetical protein
MRNLKALIIAMACGLTPIAVATRHASVHAGPPPTRSVPWQPGDGPAIDGFAYRRHTLEDDWGKWMASVREREKVGPDETMAPDLQHGTWIISGALPSPSPQVSLPPKTNEAPVGSVDGSTPPKKTP